MRSNGVRGVPPAYVYSCAVPAAPPAVIHQALALPDDPDSCFSHDLIGYLLDHPATRLVYGVDLIGGRPAPTLLYIDFPIGGTIYV